MSLEILGKTFCDISNEIEKELSVTGTERTKQKLRNPINFETTIDKSDIPSEFEVRALINAELDELMVSLLKAQKSAELLLRRREKVIKAKPSDIIGSSSQLSDSLFHFPWDDYKDVSLVVKDSSLFSSSKKRQLKTLVTEKLSKSGRSGKELTSLGEVEMYNPTIQSEEEEESQKEDEENTPSDLDDMF
ncbi:hypothetical protein ADUPG1_008297 [Aduncisulcus paluster]|uniref:Uncharacterized protein n=1 Tax=Aduncisulcus paluster TaxID=2918883 RepID=A0ABQ5KSS4_9EUKA|nr:hypothetical protein ADUPG1_008297 [Aduncisulcus paluster]